MASVAAWSGSSAIAAAGLGQPRQVPLRDGRLVAEGVAPVLVDGAEHGRGIVGLQERAGPEVDRLPRDRHVVRVHHPVDEARRSSTARRGRPGAWPPPRGGRGRAAARRQCRGRAARSCSRRAPQLLRLAAGSEELERPDADVTRRHAREHRTRQRALALRRLARGRDRQRPRGGNAQRMHRLADQHLAQHRPDRGLPSPLREQRAPRTLEGDVPATRLPVNDFTQQHRAPVPSFGEKPPNWWPA